MSTYAELNEILIGYHSKMTNKQFEKLRELFLCYEDDIENKFQLDARGIKIKIEKLIEEIQNEKD